MNCFYCSSRDEKIVSHTGGAVGASSVLLLHLPPTKPNHNKSSQDGQIRGVVVAMITNLQDVGLSQTAKKIAKEFAWMIDEELT